ncbi:MAG: hypothetical protein LBG69_06395 [Zoogloeaceae bacterium]|jgi:methanogenic corrinoid protein MtbC1|nr:hypothetical protein [Zoogloeaceae bacterium]
METRNNTQISPWRKRGALALAIALSPFFLGIFGCGVETSAELETRAMEAGMEQKKLLDERLREAQRQVEEKREKMDEFTSDKRTE